ncbi:hypothetical protein KFK14_23610 [Sphingobium phenoxybenzoativorans]|uniref:VCBS repeat-containing protein n=1 Tax=Sphingobium phenoxybenzoativorans TaxID=1592790 RepID=A0A975K6U4_9SPHN|nr:hypothetical protein [Sphingobium phenoxybenzoativorans]QUT05880.1 hypothetical protein KFK14_23610 [Sphingobium phenoxybenzoativorans]
MFGKKVEMIAATISSQHILLMAIFKRAWTAVSVIGISLSAPADAGPFPPIAFIAMGYKETTLDTLTGSTHYSARLADPAGFLSVTADFNGDGRDDEARILSNAAQGDARIVVVIQSPDKVDTYVLNSFAIGALDQIGIRLVPADSRHTLPGLAIFRFGGQGEVNRFNGEEFDRMPLQQ